MKYKVLGFVLIITLISMFCLLSGRIASAHAPTSIETDYDHEFGEIQVTITHPVASPSSHYIEEIKLMRNGAQVDNISFHNQPDDTRVTYTFEYDMVEGDEVTVEATCNQVGSISDKFTVGSEDDNKGEEAEDEDTPFLSVGILSITVALAVMALRFNRPRRK